MTLTDMKLPKRSEKELKACEPSLGSREQWPYGLQLRFDNEQIKKMASLKELEVGDEVYVEAKGTVTMVRRSDRQNEKPDQTLEIQIKKIGIENKDSQKKQIKELTR